MKNDMENLEGYLGCEPSQYISRNLMDKLGEWATEVEILATASLLGCDIFVYCKVGNNMDWQNHPASLCLKKKTDYALYILNKKNYHYDVVLSVKQFVNLNV